jgi:hypothetical protein
MAVSHAQGLEAFTGLGPIPPVGFPRGLRMEAGSSLQPTVKSPGPGESQGAHRTFRGHFSIPALARPFPEETFVENRYGDHVVLQNQPEGSWPRVLIELSQDGPATPFQGKGVIAWNADDSVEAWIHLTRLMFYVTRYEGWSVVEEDGTAHELPSSVNANLWPELRQLCSVVRKLAYIGDVFDVDFSIPEVLSQNDILTTELAFRAITEGEFTLRSGEINFRQLYPDKLDFEKPPFAGPGSFSVRRQTLEQSTASLLGHSLDLGPYTISVDQAEIANHSALYDIERQGKQPIDIKVVVYDHQVKYSFDNYASKKNGKINSRRLAAFKKNLLEEEPEELVSAIDESLQLEVASYETSQIAIGWLEYNRFPNCYSPQKPVLEQQNGKWRVAVHLAYPSGKGGPVGELSIDLKTGVVVSHTSVETMRAKGAALAETLLDAE